MIKLLEDLLIEATTNPNVPGSLVAGLRKAVEDARAGVMPSEVATDPPYRVCIKAHETNVGNTVPVGHVVTLEVGESMQQPDCWAPCDKDGWVSCRLPRPGGLAIEWRGHPGWSDWRPARAAKPSAIDEMAEQMGRWAAPTREDVAQPALAVQEGGSHYKSMKVQPVEYIHANGLGYCEGNVVKYVSRWRAKGGLQDLKKARHYVDLLIELEGDTK